jgi:hypothetical protein
MSKTTEKPKEELRGQVRLKQGDIIEIVAALLPSTQSVDIEKSTQGMIAIVVSHDCDIEAEARKDPFVEVIPITLIDKLEPRNSHTRNARTLDIEARETSSEKRQPIRIGAPDKQPIHKNSLWEREFVRPYTLVSEDLIELADWLSSRYRRAALPEEFGKRFSKIQDDFWKLIQNHNHDLSAILFYFDEGQEEKECVRGESYSLSISLVFPAGRAKPELESLVEEIQALFETSYEDQSDEVLPEIELRQCLAISESDITLEAYKAGVFLRSEWISYGAVPRGPLVRI